MIEIAGITRKTDFSPGHIMNDYLIINKTKEELEKLGAKITLYSEDDLGVVEIKEDYIFSMVQGPVGTEKLSEIAADKKLIMNTPQSVMNCYRYNLIEIMEKNDIPFPESRIITDKYKIPEELKNCKDGLWIKRGDAHASCKEDVVKVESYKEILPELNKFLKRGIERWAIQKHIEGNIIKFYGVTDTDFFYYYYQPSKYYNDFNESDLVALANLAAEALGLDVYGGDAVITENSDIIIIDVNDWPSFAPIKDEASKVIAKKFFSKIEQIQ